MAELVPHPFASLVTRMFRELDHHQAIFDLPARAFFSGHPDCDFRVRFHGHEVGSPLGPAAGPQTQMAQNIVLSWLGGCRIFELKTVQINDELTIPRPCIDMRTVGYNAEWSQELKLEQSLEEYVKGAMLVEMLRTHDATAPRPSFQGAHYDVSVGYDLVGIQSDHVRRFLEGMKDAREVVDRLRDEIPDAVAPLRNLDYPTALSDTVTLSTFHGCPPNEIESIIDHLMREHHLHCVVKFNPMLLGPEETRYLLHDVLGYHDIRVPDSAFERDTRWDQAVEMMDRLGETARSLGLGLGAKFTNTLIVENTAGFLPADEKEVYLSGPPLHVLAIQLVRRFRERFGDRFPVSFSAGIDRRNYPDAAALGLLPITVCTDLLQPKGYGRLWGYHEELADRMEKAGANDLETFTIRAYGLGLLGLAELGLDAADPVAVTCRKALETGGDLRTAAGPDLFARWVSACRWLNTDRYANEVKADNRYARARNHQSPKKIGRHLRLFDCITCDKCIPVCPNDANFAFGNRPATIPVVTLRPARAADDAGDVAAPSWIWHGDGTLTLTEKHQIGTFADFCNECGNCDVFCPEDGGPYLMKPLFFGSEAGWRQWSDRGGFHLSRHPDGDRVLGRFGKRKFEMTATGRHRVCTGSGVEVRFDLMDPQSTLDVRVDAGGPDEIDLTPWLIMEYLRFAILDTDRVSWIGLEGESTTSG